MYTCLIHRRAFLERQGRADPDPSADTSYAAIQATGAASELPHWRYQAQLCADFPAEYQVACWAWPGDGEDDDAAPGTAVEYCAAFDDAGAVPPLLTAWRAVSDPAASTPPDDLVDRARAYAAYVEQVCASGMYG